MKTQKQALFLLACFYSFSGLTMDSSKTNEPRRSNAEVRKEIAPLLSLLYNSDIQKLQKLDITGLSNEINEKINQDIPSRIIKTLNEIDTYIPGIPQEIVIYEKLYENNNYFKSLLLPFIQDIVGSLELVTGKSIDKVTDPKYRWENLNPFIKKIIFTKAEYEFFKQKNTTQEYLLKGHTKPIKSISINKETRRVASTSLDGTVRIWNLITGTCSLTLEPTNKISSICFDNTGEQIAVVYQNHPIVHIYDSTSGKIIDTLKHNEPINSVSFLTIYDQPTFITFCKNKQLAYAWNRKQNKKSPIALPFICTHKDLLTHYKDNDFEIKNTKQYDLSYNKKSPAFTLCKRALENDPTNFQALFFSEYVNKNLEPIEKNKLRVLAGQ